MGQFMKNILIVFSLFIYIFIIYIFMKVNIKNKKSFKRLSLYLNGLCGINKNVFWESIKIIYLLVIGILSYVFFVFKNIHGSFPILPNLNISRSIIVVVVGFFGVLQITLFAIIVIVEVFLKKDSRAEMKEISWIKFHRNKPMYTGIVRPILYAAGEFWIFYYVIFNILKNQCNFNHITCIILLSILYSFSKLIAVHNVYQAIIYGTWSFFLSFSTSCIFIYSQGILPAFMLLLLYSFLVAFKE